MHTWECWNNFFVV